ncbi:2'-5' RNA ligase family protein [Mycolicibacterium neoaurum]|uniref:2'-5' RNA ligase family protein n=1 Tax=Mycolicibacterium neoaurum TaxID=1795 RepID=UPI001BCBA4ED|nr:2'-5' RNA ligase family protein [Mycolicibacterium neoaurum]QVI26017.1 2'-5' RNA ligase family protein [Mycolicibacterium neoaurum]
MVHSVELTLDDAGDAAVRRIWTGLQDAGLPSQADHTGASNRPHTTLTVAEDISGAADTDLVAALPRLPMPCRLGAPVVFGHGRYTVALLVVPSAQLLDLHAQVHRICLPHMTSGALPHTGPGSWTPHVTVARRVAAEQLAAVCEIAAAGREIEGGFAGLRHWDGNARIVQPITG